MNRFHCLKLAILLLALPGLAWPKEEILPTKRGQRPRQGQPQNPLHSVADDMDGVARRLTETKTDDATQDAQGGIVRKLEALIEAARQQSQKQPKGGKGDAQKRQPKPQPQPSPEEQKKQAEKDKQNTTQKQERTSRPSIGKAGSGTPDGALHTDDQEWGNLPPAIRDQLLQTQGEGFPLKYRELLRRYYRQLAKPRE